MQSYRVYIETLLLAGTLAGIVNFFTNYVALPFSRPASGALLPDPNKLKDIWWVAIIGYLAVGITGSLLTPLMNALAGGLKGLDKPTDGSFPAPGSFYYLVLFGYGLVFGYATTRLLISLLDVLSKKVVTLEKRVDKLEGK